MDSGELARFLPKIEFVANGCIEWTAALNEGYGVLRIFRDGAWRVGLAHRLAYEHYVGPIPEGLELDHLCRNRKCCNHNHLEPVTRRENLLRGDTLPASQVRRTHCPKGHEYTQINTRLHRRKRQCIACARIYDRLRKTKGFRKLNQTGIRL